MNTATGRHEIKHYVNYADFLQLRSRLRYVASPDENAGESNCYRVRSLYFDNYNDKVLREKIDGVNEREKFRIRFYNQDTSFIRLEKKSKKNNLCYKQSSVISAELCRQLLAGRYEGLKETGDPLLLELYTKLHSQLLRPKNIVDYRREAYVYPPGNVRITLDDDIRACMDVEEFLAPALVSIPLHGRRILEVKYDAFLPEIIRGMVALGSREQSAFSKYAATRIR